MKMRVMWLFRQPYLPSSFEVTSLLRTIILLCEGRKKRRIWVCGVEGERNIYAKMEDFVQKETREPVPL